MKVAVSDTTMPAVFLDWQCDARRDMFEALVRGEHPRFLSAHLPVVSTLNAPGATFPIHSTTKGVGLLPKRDHLAEHVAEISDCLARSANRSKRQTLGERVQTALSLYERQERIDAGVFGGIEIFGGQTYTNLLRDPRVTLLFTGLAPRYPSYQFNCVTEIVELDDLRFQFLRGMRLLFELESFHIQQPDYALGYLFHIQEVYDKTPRQLGRCSPPAP